jgi:hypothetical protein
MTTGQVNIGEWRAIGFSLDRQMVYRKKEKQIFFVYFLFIY